MPRVKVAVVACAALIFGAGGAAFGSGYAIYEQGAKAMAEAGAFTARADDPSALFFNPAGILQLDGSRFYGGTTAIWLGSSTLDSATTGAQPDQIYMTAWPSSLYFTQKLTDHYAWGLGITSPFGLKTNWDSKFEGRYISRESNLAVGNVNANFAFTLGSKWSAAVGFNYAKADIRALSKNIDFSAVGAPDGFTTLTGNGHATGWNLALRWVSPEGWRWGASYRSSMKPTINGNVTFENIPTVGPVSPAAFPDGGATATLPLPATLATGFGFVSHKGRGKWEAEFDLVWTDWSEFDHLRIDLENNTPLLADIDQVEQWHDTYSYRAGFCYHATPRQDWRAGIYYDRNPIADQHVRPRLPDADRKSVQIGYGFHGKGGFVFDAAYQALFFDDRNATGSLGTPKGSGSNPVVPGTYSTFTSLLGVSLGWKF